MTGLSISIAPAETIYVAATATDGWERASWLDASATPKALR
jgi:hypothetical protein